MLMRCSVLRCRARTQLAVVTTMRQWSRVVWMAGALIGGAVACTPTAPPPIATFDLRITPSAATVAGGDSVMMNVAIARTSDKLLPGFLGGLSLALDVPSGIVTRADLSTCWAHSNDPGWFMPLGYDSQGCAYVVSVERTVAKGRYTIVVSATAPEFAPRRETFTITVIAPAP